MMDVLPAPVAPTMATFSPSAMWNETSFNTQLPGSYANQTLRNSISPRMRLRLDGAALSRTAGRSSRIWKIRSELAIACCMMLYFSLRSRIGWKNRSTYCRNATTPRSEEHTSELQSPYDLVCRLLLEKKHPQ